MATTYTVYSLSDSNGVRYIGMTAKSLSSRLARHLSAKRYRHKYNWIQKVLRETGSLPTITAIATGLTKEEAVTLETKLIASYRVQLGKLLLNLTEGGDGFHSKHSEETKAKLRQLKPKKAVKSSNGNKYQSVREAGRLLGISPGHITKCCQGLRKTAGGYSWEYILIVE